MVTGRLTPPSVQDGPYGWEADGETGDNLDRKVEPLDAATALKLGRDCFEASTSWLNAGRRLAWSNSLRAFQGHHPSGSKYHSRDYSYRSSLFRPKTRAMVRKAEAQTAAAFFSNDDVLSVRATDDDDPQQQASAAILQALLQYRLTHTIPWFLTLLGARQDCEVMGIAVARAKWNYEERKVGRKEVLRTGDDGLAELDEEGMPQTDTIDDMEKVKDEPEVSLISPENFRFDPGADWRFPVKDSPYLIETIPMYLNDVRAKIDSGEWNDVSDGAIMASTDRQDDITRRAREFGRVPGKDDDVKQPRAFTICWIHRNIMKWAGEDWHFVSLGGSGELLTEPQLLKEVELHGERPYVCGFVVLETHKTYPSSKVEIVRDLQRMANDVLNLRQDNVKLALNPRQFLAQGAGAEIGDVRSFAPGKIVITKDPTKDIVWDRPPEVTASAYEEQDRINLDFDELVGDFSNTSVQSSEVQQQSATGMNLMSGMASGMNEYELRIFADTFVEPLLRLLVKLEQAYETDPIILATAGKKAEVFERFGISAITDELLNLNVTTKVNVGIGATNPEIRLRRFLMAGQALGQLYGPAMPMGLVFDEVVKEIMGLSGYKDGARFFKPGFDPVQAMQQMAQANQKPGAQAAPPDPMRLQAAEVQARAKVEAQQIDAQSAERRSQAEMQMQQADQSAENWRAMLSVHKDIALQQANHTQQTTQAMMPRPVPMARPARPPR